jgi:hypothetical protein|tara:strand:+ start:1615 stop:2019 length:405 start_codon:yes stop_codon:yes gene_type:complete
LNPEEDVAEPGPAWEWDCDISGREYTAAFGSVEEIFDGEPSAAIWYSNPSDPDDQSERPILVPMGMMVEALAQVYDPAELRDFFDDIVMAEAGDPFEELLGDSVHEIQETSEPTTDAILQKLFPNQAESPASEI